MKTLTIRSRRRDDFLLITDQVVQIAQRAGVNEGLCIVFVPHTTAGVTINENADPSVVHDLVLQLDTFVPWHQPGMRHQEGNSAAHLKASLFGSSVTIPIHNGRLALGVWQGIYLCDFDGPRSRKVHVQIVATDTTTEKREELS